MNSDRLDLVPWRQFLSVVRVLAFGERKHGKAFGWQERPREEHRAAMVRHIEEYLSGMRADHETGEPTLAHVIARALFLLWHDQKGIR